MERERTQNELRALNAEALRVFLRVIRDLSDPYLMAREFYERAIDLQKTGNMRQYAALIAGEFALAVWAFFAVLIFIHAHHTENVMLEAAQLLLSTPLLIFGGGILPRSAMAFILEYERHPEVPTRVIRLRIP